MSLDLEEIKAAAIAVREETEVSANTAMRIGQLFLDMANMIGETMGETETNGSAINGLRSALRQANDIMARIENDISELTERIDGLTALGIQMDGDTIIIGGNRYVLTREEDAICRGVVSDADALTGAGCVGVYVLRKDNMTQIQHTAKASILIVSAESNGNTYQHMMEGVDTSSSVMIGTIGARMMTRSYNADDGTWSAWSEISARQMRELEKDNEISKQTLSAQTLVIDSKVLNSEISQYMTEL